MVLLQCTPHLGHVVTFHFQYLRVNTKKIYTVLMKQSDIFDFDKCEITVDKKMIL